MLVATCLEDSIIFRANVDGREGSAYLEHSVVGEGCCHDRSRAESDQSYDEKLGFFEHDEVERKEEELGM